MLRYCGILVAAKALELLAVDVLTWSRHVGSPAVQYAQAEISDAALEIMALPSAVIQLSRKKNGKRILGENMAGVARWIPGCKRHWAFLSPQ